MSKYGKTKVISAPPQRAQLKKQETNAQEVIVVMKPKIMNSLKTELQRMAQAEEKKKDRGTLEGRLFCSLTFNDLLSVVYL